MNNQTKASGQFIQDTIHEAMKKIPSHLAQTIAKQEVRIVQQEVEIERLNKLMQGWDQTEAEIRIEAVQDFMHEVINNQFYSKDALITFYRNYVREIGDV